ncbi:hypothetical protein SCHPADRAFT_132203 [Schizopora paradoxa]|uniref:MYND-type domain-containing protein n=1 Tax=Schizopora paradoxa TaxID=27342 RepID=A0A0H2SM58_9AGAM|nr:hypothetical protein SCHPADRAFT_132203 [Schizopora paradoxa]
MARRELSNREAIKLLQAARTEEKSLNDLAHLLTSSTRDLPERYCTRAFDVLHSRLQNPVSQALLDDSKTCRSVMASIIGLSALGEDFYPNHKPLLRQCWPDFICWAKAIFRGRKYHGMFLHALDTLFNEAAAVDIELIDNDDMFDFTIELWNGEEEGVLARNRYTLGPLSAILDLHEYQTEKFLTKIGSNAAILVQTLLSRIAAVSSSEIEKGGPADLLIFLNKLSISSVDKILDALIRSTDLVPIVCHGLIAVLDAPNLTTMHRITTGYGFNVLAQFSITCAENICKALRNGILRIIFAVETNKSRNRGERTTQVIHLFQRGLVFDYVVSAAVAAMNGLANKQNFDLTETLRSVTPEFRAEWMRFESLLLEQATIFKLINLGYAQESGICASCRKTSLRKDFKKCAGCGNVLYCSMTCARNDWSRHKVDCQTVSGSIQECFPSLDFDRVARRLGTLQVSRCWLSTISRARDRAIPLSHLGVFLDHQSCPFKFNIFDFREDNLDCQHVLKENYLARLVAKEVERVNQGEGSYHCFMLVVSHMGMQNVPYLVYLEEVNAEGAQTNNPRSTYYADENGRLLATGTHDAVEDIISRMLSNTNWRALWREKPFERLAAQFAQEKNLIKRREALH